MDPLLAVMEVSLTFLTVLPALDPVAGTRVHQLSRQDCTECSAETDEQDAGTGGLIFQMSRVRRSRVYTASSLDQANHRGSDRQGGGHSCRLGLFKDTAGCLCQNSRLPNANDAFHVWKDLTQSNNRACEL